MPAAARLGDMTNHGGMISQGEKSVLIRGQPAARVGDTHVCPMVDGNKPHVGGPVGPLGSKSVIIRGQPAARVGDPAVCTGPPDTIQTGENSVIIGG